MKLEQVIAKRAKLMEKLSEVKAKTEYLKAQLKALQCLCPHTNAKNDYDNDPRGSSSSWSCPDCGAYENIARSNY